MASIKPRDSLACAEMAELSLSLYGFLQGNGLVERLNRSLIGILRRYGADQPLDWDLWLPAALHANRVTKQTSTGVSPFELLYGNKPGLATDIKCGNPSPVPTDTTEHLNQLHQQMKTITSSSFSK